MSLFRKPKRNFRQRNTKNDSDEENNGETESGKSQGTSEASENSIFQPESRKEKQVNDNKKPVATAGMALSFDNEAEEEEGEVFKVKKSSYSRRLMKQLEKERKKKTRDKDATPAAQPDTDPIEQKISFKPTIMNGDDLDEMDIDSDDEIDDKQTPDPFRKILESGNIPDAAMIHAARKRRQLAREQSEFITLKEPESEKPTSRLVRDDDNDRSDDDDDEHGGRISFSAVKPQHVKERTRETILALTQDDDDAVDEEVDEELERWEQEQIRKGVSIPQVPVTQNGQVFSSYGSYQPPERMTSHPAEPFIPPPPETKMNTSIVPPPIVPSEKSIMTLASYKKHLLDRLESRHEVYRARERERDSIQDELISRGNRILELEEAVPKVASAFTFYQEMRGYVTDLVECLDEKMGKINQLETSYFQLLKQRALRLVQRSQQDTKDQSEEFMAMFCKNQQNIQDPLNRDSAKARRAAEREGRRTRRRRARETRDQSIVHYEGMSSDDEEMEADIVQFNTEKERILDEASHVFDDVVEEYHSINLIKKRFEKWKEVHADTYKSAYIGLCMPKVFTPLVRLQLISWNPVEESRDFEQLSWFESLMFYGYSETQYTQELKEDDDTKVIPIIVERVVLPKLSELVEHVWNPISTSQTLRLINLVTKLVNEYPTVNGKNKKTIALLEVVVKRMRRTLDEDVYMPPYPKSALDNKLSGANAFFQRQFWTCVKILYNLLSWQGIVNDDILKEVALDGLLTRYILWGMNISPLGKDTLVKAEMVTATIPRSWFVKRESDSTIPQLEMFCKYLKTVAEAMRKTNGPDNLNSIENTKEIVKMLLTLGATNHADDLIFQFGIKDIKILKE